MKILGLIPTRIGSTRLPSKPLLEINKLPLIIHTYKRAKMSKLLDDVIICCDDKKIMDIAKKFNFRGLKVPPGATGNPGDRFKIEF